MIFGLMNGPAYFSKAMHQALGPLRDSVVLFYLDDILIPGTSWEDLKPKLKSVFEALRKTGLTIKLAKCKFLYQTVAYLGHEISANGIAPGLNKVGAIKDFPSPQNVHDVRRYLGLTSYFRKFIPRFAQIAEPLHHLLKANVEFEWKEPQRIAFELLKSKLIEGPVLQLFNPHAETELHTDASSSGLAAMLMQKDEAGKLRLIYAISRRTSIPESNYHSSKLELLAIVWAVSRLRTMLANIPFTIVTDCQALCYMSTQKTLNPQMVRWNDLLSEYDYKIVHRPGVRLAHVDALSRAPVENHDSLENLSVMSINNEKDTVRMYQYIDSEILNKKKILEKPKNQRTKHEQSAVTDFSLIEGIVYKIRNDRLLYVVPRAMRKSLVVQFHDLKSHQGIDRTVSRIMEHYYFPRMKSYVKRHIRACLQCIASKAVPGRQAGELHPITPGHRPSAVIHIDHLGPFVTSSRGNKYVFAIIDNLTKFVIIRAVKDTKTASVVRILDEVVQEYGAPTRIVSDRGTSFTSSVFEAFCKKHGIRHTLNSPRHPQANGQVERLNATLIPAIQNNLVQNDGRDWDKNICKIRNDLNEMKNASTSKSPFELVYGYVPRRGEGEVRKLTCDNESTYSNPSKLQQEAKRKIAIEQAKMKIRYDANRIRNVEFDVGCLVYMKTAPIATGESTKLQLRYRGPLVIVRKLSSDTYLVSDLSDNVPGRRYATTAHASQLKLWEAERIESDDDSNNDESGPDTSSEDEARIQQRDNVLKLRNADVTACNDMTVSANEISEIECLKNNCQNANVSMNAIEESELRRSTRIKKAPQKLKDYELNS